jgi:15-cis-phytoene synthase
MTGHIAQAYRECEQITWSQARNFAYGIRLLPPAKRQALAAVYAFARRVDDIGDGTLPASEKLGELERARRDVQSLSDTDDLVIVALADVAKRFPVPMDAFGELIDGCVADVKGTTYETFDELHYYCRCVAGSVGRLSLGIFGSAGQNAPQLADDLGIALQLTNILRDIREDHENGRVYLPQEDLKKFDCAIGEAQMSPQFGRLMEFEIGRARDWYATGLKLLPLLDYRSRACTGAMAGIYRTLLERIAEQPAAVLRGRVSLSGGEKARVAAKALTGRIS